MTPPDRILDEAILQIDRKAGLPTVRDIAAGAGVSPALVLYRFGDMQGVRAAAFLCAAQKEHDLWIQRTEDYLGAPLALSDLEGLLRELLIAESRQATGLSAVRWLRSLNALRSGAEGDPGIVSEGEMIFWSTLAAMLNLPRREQRLLTAFHQGIAFAHMIAGAEAGFAAWSHALVARFAARFSGGAPGLLGSDSAFRSAAASRLYVDDIARDQRAHPTRIHILETAIRILITEGADSLTHRRLAAEAEASVSSVVHFFSSRRSLLKQAYEALYGRLRTRALAGLGHASRLGDSISASILAAHLQPADPRLKRQNEIELAGLLNAMFEASRS